MLALVPQCLLSSKSLPSLGLRLTLRSTGHFTACQVWAKIRAQTRHAAKCRLTFTLDVVYSKFCGHQRHRTCERHFLSTAAILGTQETNRSNLIPLFFTVFRVNVCTSSKLTVRVPASRRLLCSHAGSRSAMPAVLKFPAFARATPNPAFNRTHCGVPAFGL